VVIYVVVVVGAAICLQVVVAAFDMGREVLTGFPIPVDEKTYRLKLRIPFDVVD
jgi:hypothetical protein